jgi:hypothetical protein
MCKHPGLTSDVSKLALLLLFLTGRWQCQSVVSSCVREPQKRTQPLPRPGGPARQTSAQPGRAGASMEDDPSAVGAAPFASVYDPHSEGTYPDFLPSGTPNFSSNVFSQPDAAVRMASAMAAASRLGRTSWTLIRCAPCKMVAVTAAKEALARRSTGTSTPL